jgi:DNA-binding LacI/PurR family transcriptional regulator
MKGGPTTMRDIAIKLGVSISTVSRALRDVPDINPETKKAVLDLADKLNYKPNPFASNLVKNRSNLIGVIVPNVEENFFARVITGIQSIVFDTSFNVIITNVNDDQEREKRDVENFLLSRTDALIMAPTHENQDFGHLQEILKRKVPLVFFDRFIEEVPASKIVVDDFEGAFNAVEYLISTGCRRIAHLAGHDALSLARDRKEGYRAALKKHGLYSGDHLILTSGYQYQDGIAAARKLIAFDPLPDAVFGVSDRVTIGAMNEFQRLGYKTPNEVSFIGFTNEPVTEMVSPALTTVEQRAHDIGREAGKMALKLINQRRSNKDNNIETIILKTRLIVRNSTR